MFTRVLAVCAIGLSAVACAGSGSPSLGTYQSGSRLRAHVYDGGGGATMLLDWFDLALQTPCAFGRAADGNLRCLPSTAPKGNAPFGGDPYLDAGCTERALVFSDISALPPFVEIAVHGATGECPPSVRDYFRLGPERLGVHTYHAKLPDGSCVEQSLMGARVFELGEHVDATELVAAHATTEAHGALDIEILLGEDGSIAFGSILDHARREACFIPASAGRIDVDFRCLPVSAANDDVWFADPSCTGQRYAYASDPECLDPEPTLAIRDTGTCHQLEVVQLGPRDADASLYSSNGGVCTGLTPDFLSTVALYPEKAPVDEAAFPEATVARLGTGPLQLAVSTAPDGRALRPLGFLDTKRDALCWPTRFSDGVIRCKTSDTPCLYGVFADAMCTQELATGSGLGCSLPHEAISCVNSFDRVVELTARFDGPIFAVEAGGACISVMRGDRDYWLVGADVDPDDVFPTLTERTE